MSCPTSVNTYVVSGHFLSLLVLVPNGKKRGIVRFSLEGCEENSVRKDSEFENVIKMLGMIIIISLSRKVISLESSCDKVEQASN